jgi:O-antigen biosynthesis protein
MNRHESQARPPVLVIGGMHRSTTSLAASILTAAGLHLGDDLMGAGTGNEAGHFEDNDFYMLHQRILAANGLSLEGYTSAERIDVPATARDEAVAVLARRRAAGRPWGWKDPRTVLFLDFWADLLPEARWLFVVRPPWDVVDSLFRRGDTAFRANPRFAAEVWVAYNRRILDFVHTRPDHTVVVTAADVITDHAGFVRRASDLLGMPLETPASQFRPDLYAAGQPPHRAGLVRGAAPEAYELYRSLAELAGAQRQGLDHCGSPPRLADVAAAGLIEWNNACQAIAERGGFSAQVTEARQAVETASQELATERDTVVRTQAHVDELTRSLVTERAARAEVTAYAEQLAQELAAAREAAGGIQAHVDELTRDLVTERAARAEVTASAESFTAQLAAAQTDLARARAESEARRLEVEARLAVSDREWSARLASERTRRESETDQLTAALAEARASVESLTREAAARAADHDSAIKQLEIERDAARAERESFETTLKADRDALTAQLDAERGIYESLRQDLTGRIEVARSSRRKAG